MSLVVRGITFHTRRCRRCLEIFHTTAKYNKNPACFECAKNKSTKAIPKKRWKEILKEHKKEDNEKPTLNTYRKPMVVFKFQEVEEIEERLLKQ